MRMTEYEFAALLVRRKGEKVKLSHLVLPKVPQKNRSTLEIEFEFQLFSVGILCQTEYRPIKERLWRIDFAWPDLLLGVEVDGEVHRIKSRFHGDLEKNAALLLAGWRILHVRRKQIFDGTALKWVLCLLHGDSRMKLPQH